ncbi:hypothetical protein HRbin29_00677 [bacterium HR29]|jgi:uncharacterized membrane protein|nr:hypothetical protein HRbin29_00677 [bacterium HR29]
MSGEVAVAAAVLAAVGMGGSAMVAVGAAGARGRLPRNRWAGIRLPSTMASDAAWEAAHRAAGPMMAASGGLADGVALLAALLLWVGVLSAEGALWAGLGAALLILAPTPVATAIAVRRASRAVSRGASNGDTR